MPRYAILSHTWGDDEVTFEDMQDEAEASSKASYAKIRESCRLSREYSLDYVWIDTCCIDKSSSAELSEAINSMFTWYRDSVICYAYLADVNGNGPFSTENFTKSRWLTRGWTLQELLAPTELDFYDSSWTKFDSRMGASAQISAATGIDETYLKRQPDEQLGEMLSHASIAERMCWASGRETRDEEDVAYCLLGIFAINMPLLYGEGKRAFRRLQEEIVKHSDDQSLFAWGSRSLSSRRGAPGIEFVNEYHSPGRDKLSGFLATSPSDFAKCGDLVPFPTGFRRSVFSITNKGMHITLPMFGHHALLECNPKDDPTTLTTLELSHLHGDTYSRVFNLEVGEVDYQAWHKWKRRTINIVTHPEWHHSAKSQAWSIIIKEIPEGYEVANRQFTFDPKKMGYGEVKDMNCILTREGLRSVRLRIRLREIFFFFMDEYKLFLHENLADESGQTHNSGGTFLTTADGNVLYLNIRRRTIVGEVQVLIDVLSMQRGFISTLYQAIDLVCFLPSRLFQIWRGSYYPRSMVTVVFLWPSMIIRFCHLGFKTITLLCFHLQLCEVFPNSYFAALPSIFWLASKFIAFHMTPRPKYGNRLAEGLMEELSILKKAFYWFTIVSLLGPAGYWVRRIWYCMSVLIILLSVHFLGLLFNLYKFVHWSNVWSVTLVSRRADSKGP